MSANKNIIEEVRVLIKRDELEEVFKLLGGVAFGIKDENTLVILNARFEELKKQQLRNTLNYSDLDKAKNQIRGSLLEFINSVTPSTKEEGINLEDSSLKPEGDIGLNIKGDRLDISIKLKSRGNIRLIASNENGEWKIYLVHEGFFFGGHEFIGKSKTKKGILGFLKLNFPDIEAITIAPKPKK